MIPILIVFLEGALSKLIAIMAFSVSVFLLLIIRIIAKGNLVVVIPYVVNYAVIAAFCI